MFVNSEQDLNVCKMEIDIAVSSFKIKFLFFSVLIYFQLFLISFFLISIRNKWLATKTVFV